MNQNSDIDARLAQIDQYLALIDSNQDVSPQINDIKTFVDSIQQQYNIEINSPELDKIEKQIEKISGKNSFDQLLFEDEIVQYIKETNPGQLQTVIDGALENYKGYGEEFRNSIKSLRDEFDALSASGDSDIVKCPKYAVIFEKVLSAVPNIIDLYKRAKVLDPADLYNVDINLNKIESVNAKGRVDRTSTKQSVKYDLDNPIKRNELLNNVKRSCRIKQKAENSDVNTLFIDDVGAVVNKIISFITTNAAILELENSGFANRIKDRYTQAGGAPIDDTKKIILTPLMKQLLRIKLLKEREYFLSLKIANANIPKEQPPSDAKEYMKKDIKQQYDYFGPVATLIQYNLGNINEFDRQLLSYLSSIGFSENVIMAIYLAQRKQDIYLILKTNYPQYQGSLFNILRLKKMSAHQKFRSNYGIASENELVQLKQIGSIYFH